MFFLKNFLDFKVFIYNIIKNKVYFIVLAKTYLRLNILLNIFLIYTI